MIRWFALSFALCGAFLLGLLPSVLLRPAPPLDAPSVVERMREVARLETLEVSVYRKVTLEPAPAPSATLLGDVVQFARHSVAPRRGRAIVFGDAHLGLDLARLDEGALRTWGDHVEVRLPPVTVRVELRPGETEVIDSNLDSAQTAELLAVGQQALELDLRADRRLQQRARTSAERAVRAVLVELGFREVTFVGTAVARAGSSPSAVGLDTGLPSQAPGEPSTRGARGRGTPQEP